MDLLKKIKNYEYLNIVFWLIKDSCWMLDFKILATIMILPTLGLATMIVYHSWRTIDVYINASIFFWICANSVWMILEFFGYASHTIWASVPFALGFVFVGIYYYKRLMGKKPLKGSS
ncbi:MAG: hypothetical protein V4565_04150 [Bacteroidota bacterium]